MRLAKGRMVRPRDPMAVVARFLDAANGHDAETMAATVHPDFESVQPLHPGRNFRGAEQLISNWKAIFEAEPDFRLTVVRTSTTGNTVWLEVEGAGHRADVAGIFIVGVEDSLIRWVRVYSDRVEDVPDDRLEPEPPSHFARPDPPDRRKAAYDEATETDAGVEASPAPRHAEPVVAAAELRDPWADPDPDHRQPWDHPEPDPWADAARDHEAPWPGRDPDPGSPLDTSPPADGTTVDGEPDIDDAAVETLIGPSATTQAAGDTSAAGSQPDDVGADVPHAEFPTAMLPPYEVRISDLPTSGVPAAEVPAAEFPATDPWPAEVPGHEPPASDVPPSEVPPSAVPPGEVPAPEVPEHEVAAAGVPPPEVPELEVPAAEFPAAMLPPYEVRVAVPPSPVPASEAPPVESPASQFPASESPAWGIPSSEEPPAEAPTGDAPEHEVPAAELPAAMLPPYAVRPHGVEADEARAEEIRSDIWADDPVHDEAPPDEGTPRSERDF